MILKLLGAIAAMLLATTTQAATPDAGATRMYVVSQGGRPGVHLVLEAHQRHTAASLLDVVPYVASCTTEERTGLVKVVTAEVKAGDTIEVFSDDGDETGNAVHVHISHAVLNGLTAVHTAGCSIQLPQLTHFSATHSMRLKVGEEALINTDESTGVPWTIKRTK